MIVIQSGVKILILIEHSLQENGALIQTIVLIEQLLFKNFRTGIFMSLMKRQSNNAISLGFVHWSLRC